MGILLRPETSHNLFWNMAKRGYETHVKKDIIVSGTDLGFEDWMQSQEGFDGCEVVCKSSGLLDHSALKILIPDLLAQKKSDTLPLTERELLFCQSYC